MSDDPFTIRIFVPDGNPEGVRIIDRMNWTGMGKEYRVSGGPKSFRDIGEVRRERISEVSRERLGRTDITPRISREKHVGCAARRVYQQRRLDQ